MEYYLCLIPGTSLVSEIGPQRQQRFCYIPFHLMDPPSTSATAPNCNSVTHLLLQMEDLVEQVLELQVERVHLALAAGRRLPARPRPQLVQPVQLLQGQRGERRLDPQLNQVGRRLRTLLDLGERVWLNLKL